MGAPLFDDAVGATGAALGAAGEASDGPAEPGVVVAGAVVGASLACGCAGGSANAGIETKRSATLAHPTRVNRCFMMIFVTLSRLRVAASFARKPPAHPRSPD
jgi:hypothetical protein